jgi:hypothetical protein
MDSGRTRRQTRNLIQKTSVIVEPASIEAAKPLGRFEYGAGNVVRKNQWCFRHINPRTLLSQITPRLRRVARLLP